MGLQYLEKNKMAKDYKGQNPLAVCSLGDASGTEGEIAEVFQMAVLKKLPILYFVQDNEWDISANAKEIRAQDITENAKGFKGLETRTIDGTDFSQSFNTVKECLDIIRKERRPMLIHAKVPLLNHHTSGVRKEWFLFGTFVEALVFSDVVNVMPVDTERYSLPQWVDEFVGFASTGVVTSFIFTLAWLAYGQFAVNVLGIEGAGGRLVWGVLLIILLCTTVAVAVFLIPPTQDVGETLAIVFGLLNAGLIYFFATALGSPSKVKYAPLGSYALAVPLNKFMKISLGAQR